MSQPKTDIALERGLYHRLVDNSGMIRPDVWQQAVDGRELVGECRQCGGFMQAEQCPPSGNITWFLAVCMDCSGQVAGPARHLPGALVLHRSSRHDEMKPGSMDTRINLLTRMRDLAKKKAEAES